MNQLLRTHDVLWKDSAVRFNTFALRESLLETGKSLPVCPGLTCFEEVEVGHGLAYLAQAAVRTVGVQRTSFEQLAHSVRGDGLLMPLGVASPHSSSVYVRLDELSDLRNFPLP